MKRTIVLCAAGVLAAAAAAQVAPPERELRFVPGDEIEAEPIYRSITPTHVATFTVQVELERRRMMTGPGLVSDPLVEALQRELFESRRSYHPDLVRAALDELQQRMLGTSAGKLLSKQQKQFMRREPWIEQEGSDRRAEQGREPWRGTFELRAVSEQDARVLARAFLEVFNQYHSLVTSKIHEYLEKQRTQIAELEPKLQKARERKEHLEQAAKRLQQELFSLGDGASYSDVSREDIWKTVLEMATELRMIEIEITGVKAKINAIESIRKNKQVSPEQSRELDRLLVVQDVELAGLMARQKAAQEAHRSAARAFEIRGQIESAAKSTSRLNGTIRASKQSVESWESNVPAPAQVDNNMVVIHPVRATKDRSQD